MAQLLQIKTAILPSNQVAIRLTNTVTGISVEDCCRRRIAPEPTSVLDVEASLPQALLALIAGWKWDLRIYFAALRFIARAIREAPTTNALGWPTERMGAPPGTPPEFRPEAAALDAREEIKRMRQRALGR